MNAARRFGRRFSSVVAPDFVPTAPPATPAEIEALVKFIDSSRNLVVITGAGVSTSSGIPDYRSPNGSYSRGHKPMTLQTFLRSDESRARYWARSFVGYNMFSSVSPNAAHNALAALELRGRLSHLVTQNVDELHQRAGSTKVTELHGSAHKVVCMACAELSSRAALQERLREANPGWAESSTRTHARADGDFDLGSQSESFRICACAHCGGTLKPHVVFFGENVPPARVESTHAWVERCDGLLIVGTSMAVYSAFRFAKAADALGKRLAILSIGETRADLLPNVAVKVETDVAKTLSTLVKALA